MGSDGYWAGGWKGGLVLGKDPGGALWGQWGHEGAPRGDSTVGGHGGKRGGHHPLTRGRGAPPLVAGGAGPQAVVCGAAAPCEGHLNALPIQIHHCVHLWGGGEGMGGWTSHRRPHILTAPHPIMPYRPPCPHLTLHPPYIPPLPPVSPISPHCPPGPHLPYTPQSPCVPTSPISPHSPHVPISPISPHIPTSPIPPPSPPVSPPPLYPPITPHVPTSPIPPHSPHCPHDVPVPGGSPEQATPWSAPLMK